jgi:leucyl aminopeptidase
LRCGPAKTALITLTELEIKGRNAAWNIRQAVVAADHAGYEYTATRSKKAEVSLTKVVVLGDAAQKTAFDQGTAIAGGVQLARELGN